MTAVDSVGISGVASKFAQRGNCSTAIQLNDFLTYRLLLTVGGRLKAVVTYPHPARWSHGTWEKEGQPARTVVYNGDYASFPKGRARGRGGRHGWLKKVAAFEAF